MTDFTTLNQVRQEIQQNPLILLYIKAPNCGVCTVIEKQIDELLLQLPIKKIKASIAGIPEMASYFHALTAPVILLFYQGKEVERFARFVPKETLSTALQKWLMISETN